MYFLRIFDGFPLAGNTSIEEDQGDVAILFFDFCDFDNILLEEKGRLIKWVDNLYRLFDKICVEYGVQKIEVHIEDFIFLFFCFFLTKKFIFSFSLDCR